LVWSVATYGCESWTINAADRKRLNAFEMDMYRRMLRISWTEHRTNNSILEELEPARRFLAEVKRRKLQYFDHVVRADNLCTHVLYMASLPEKDAEEDHGDARLTTSSNGLEYPSQSVYTARKGQKRVESLGVRVSDIRSSVMRMDLGKARHAHENNFSNHIILFARGNINECQCEWCSSNAMKMQRVKILTVSYRSRGSNHK